MDEESAREFYITMCAVEYASFRFYHDLNDYKIYLSFFTNNQ
jgi:hypothetical protein